MRACPFATGTPHYGHIVGSVMKDAVPRFWTMKGYKVPRKWGWDCHGLPIENIAEKELGIKHKKEIEKMGVEKFNEFCRTKVLKYANEWETIINRLGRWADMKNSYKTMDLPFMESVWWVFKELWKKELIYEGHRIMHICTRCETTLSQSEIAEGYKDIKDLSAVVKFELEEEPATFILAWTTTPWTLIGNAALAINPSVVYCKIKNANFKDQNDNLKSKNDEVLILTKERLKENLRDGEYEIIEEFKGEKLIGKKYKPLFDYYLGKGLENEENGWKIYAGDFVTTEEGTGVVHIAPAFGEDDSKMGQEFKLPFVQHVGMDGIIKTEAVDFSGMSVKPEEDHQKTDIEIIKYLAKKNLLFAKEKYEHSYPHCWRCDTPLINYATSSWFVNIEKIKKELLENAKKINWIPSHLKEGRFGKWLEGARDWSISRQRFWASVIPIWKCECGKMKVVGSVKELEEFSGEKITDIHKHIVDKITFKCEKCGGTMKRIPDVLDTWFDSGSMPYAQDHYPFENKEKFDANFPTEFIGEGVDQTRCWFYYLHVISTAIKNSNAFKNVAVNGIVLAEDGKKMAKRLKNYPDPSEVMEKYGADALRFYLLSSPVLSAETVNFKESDVSELVRGMFRMLWNSYSFFVLYANVDNWKLPEKNKMPKNILDRWIISEIGELVNNVNFAMKDYELNKAVRYFPKFIDNLSNWYIRRSRKRFWKSENDADKEEAYFTLWNVLKILSQLMAPFTPFMADEIYKNITGNESVHLSDYPEEGMFSIDDKLNTEMDQVRYVVTKALQLRAEAKIKVRQPLQSISLKKVDFNKELVDIICDEVNIKEVLVDDNLGNLKEENDVKLSTEITKDLKLEGQAREIIRYIQEMRKEAGYEVDNRIEVSHLGMSVAFKKFEDLIAKEVLANNIDDKELLGFDLEKEFIVEGEKLTIKIKKI
jgi:isoleucyl-tRNA synthetase